MSRKKSKGWTFICSLLPGAGEMYMGFMKQGVSIMGLFFCNHSSCGNSEYRTAYDRTSDHMVLQFF